eukprot:GEMP01031215.1.p1 GENE.GEMP01031215.1~~GEMP01031215.1.p1  ORF type:complete len:507 (+),score=114.30 GEMP01031215.1:211-1731(+)
MGTIKMEQHLPERPDYIAMNLNVDDTVRCSDGTWSVRVSLRNRSYSGLYPSIQITDPTGKKHVTLSSLSDYANKRDTALLRETFNRVRNRAYDKYATEIADSKRIERLIAEFDGARPPKTEPMSMPKMARSQSSTPSASSGRPHPFSQTQQYSQGNSSLQSQQREQYHEQQPPFRGRGGSQSSTRLNASRFPNDERPSVGRPRLSRRSPSPHSASPPPSTSAYQQRGFHGDHQQHLRDHSPSHHRLRDIASGSHAGPSRSVHNPPRSPHHAANAHSASDPFRDARPSSSSHPPRNSKQPDDTSTNGRIVQRAAPGARRNTGENAAHRVIMQASKQVFDRIADAVDEEVMESGDEEEESQESRSSSQEETDDEQCMVDLEDDEYSVANGRGGKRRGGGEAGEEAADRGRPRKRMKGDPQLLDGDERVEYKGPAMAQRICEVDQQKWRIQVVLEWVASKRVSAWMPACKLMRYDGTTYSFATVQRDLPDIYEELVAIAKDVKTILPRK